jgi:hypothetical protein
VNEATLRDLFALVALHAFLRDEVDAPLTEIVTDAFFVADMALIARQEVQDYTVEGDE